MIENFNEGIKDKQPVLVVFFAEWCGHCKRLAPILEEVETEISDKVRIEKIDIDKNKELAAQFEIKAVPTLLFFDNNEIQWKKSGTLSKEQITEALGAQA